MNKFVIADVLPGKLNAMVKNLMAQMGIDDPVEAVRLFNSGEWIVSQVVCPWTVDEDGVIHFSVISNRMTGQQWIAHFGEDNVSKWGRDVLRSDQFVPTSGVKYDIAVLPGKMWKTDSERLTQNIRAEGEKRGLVKPHAEVGCLIRAKFSNDEIEKMGLCWIMTMHEPIKDSVGDPFLLGTGRGDYTLDAFYGRPGDGWRSGSGFAFALPQVSK